MKTKSHLDPLYTIFEEHLYNFEDSDQDRKTFIARVLKDYFAFLRKLKIAIPHSLESHVIDELAIQVNSMLVKKIYGCLSLDDYRRKLTSNSKRRARSRYQRLTQVSPAAVETTPPRSSLRKTSGT